MKEQKKITREEAKMLLEELKAKHPVEESEFCMELYLAVKIFFEGEAEQNGNEITLTLPEGQKFSITAKLISQRNK